MELWVDDLREPKYESWTWVKNVDDAILFLEEGNVKSISLDHDLGYHDNGYSVLLWIEKRLLETETTKYVPSLIIIHTSNPSAAKKMMLAANKIKQLCTALKYNVEVCYEGDTFGL